jgi:hypothetical protein
LVLLFIIPSLCRVWKLDFQVKGEVDKEGEEEGGGKKLNF